MKPMTPDELHRAGLRALHEALGPVGMARFIQMLDPGRGDYTEDRWGWLADEDILKRLDELEEQRAAEPIANSVFEAATSER